MAVAVLALAVTGILVITTHVKLSALIIALMLLVTALAVTWLTSWAQRTAEEDGTPQVIVPPGG